MSIINWYDKIDKQFTRKPKRDKIFSKHLIEPCSMISCIGGTGSGKSNALVNFLSLKNDAFHKILLLLIYVGIKISFFLIPNYFHSDLDNVWTFLFKLTN